MKELYSSKIPMSSWWGASRSLCPDWSTFKLSWLKSNSYDEISMQIKVWRVTWNNYRDKSSKRQNTWEWRHWLHWSVCCWSSYSCWPSYICSYSPCHCYWSKQNTANPTYEGLRCPHSSCIECFPFLCSLKNSNTYLSRIWSGSLHTMMHVIIDGCAGLCEGSQVVG